MNVVVLLNEQHVFNYLGCAGFPLLQTPNADALAADGVLFEQAVCASTPCLPSRHNLLHGLHAFQTGIYSNHHAVSPHRVPTLTMGKVFKTHGYATAACGKMHFFPYDIVMERGNYFGFDYRAGLANEAGESFDDLYPLEHPNLMHVNAQERARYGIM